MSRRPLFVFASLCLLAGFAIIALVANRQIGAPSGAVETAQSSPVLTPAPTWTPTPPATALATVAPATQAPPAPPTPAPTPVAATPALLPEFAASTQAAPAPELTPAPPAAGAVRIDEMGPVAMPTAAPLATGAGYPPTRLRIPALGLDTPILPMSWTVVEDEDGVRSEWQMVDNAAGHHINSAYPGEAGNVVLSGHNNIGGSVFRSVCVIGEPGVDWGVGDEMVLEDEAGRVFVYRVNGWHRLLEQGVSLAQRQQNAAYLNPTADARLTLVTCWPPDSNTYRVIVTGLLASIDLD